jgi:hypothetical protein
MEKRWQKAGNKGFSSELPQFVNLQVTFLTEALQGLNPRLKKRMRSAPSHGARKRTKNLRHDF